MDGVKKAVKGPVGWSVISMGTVDSTNAVAMELGEKDAPHGTVVVAENQTKGRGRLGRKWVSPAGNIYMTVILRPSISPADAGLLTMTAAVACARALREVSNLMVEIKWPNDLVVSGKKLGGILTEMKSRGRRILFVVVGIGINLGSGAEDFPPDLRSTATSLRIETGREVSKHVTIARIIDEMRLWYDELIKEGGEPILEAWRDLSSTLGRHVKVSTERETLEGTAEALDEKGRLIVRLPSGARKVISVGDVSMVR